MIRFTVKDTAVVDIDTMKFMDVNVVLEKENLSLWKDKGGMSIPYSNIESMDHIERLVSEFSLKSN